MTRHILTCTILIILATHINSCIEDEDDEEGIEPTIYDISLCV